MHHQAGVNFENFTKVKFRDILLTGTGHRDRPGQTEMYGRSNLYQNLKLNLNITSGSFVKDHLLFLLFTKSDVPLKSALSGPWTPRSTQKVLVATQSQY